MVPFKIDGSLGPKGPTRFYVDGKHVRGVTAFTLEGDFHDRIPTLTLDFSVFADEPIEGEARVYVSPRAREGLLALGWTPPPDDPEPKREQPDVVEVHIDNTMTRPQLSARDPRYRRRCT